MYPACPYSEVPTILMSSAASWIDLHITTPEWKSENPETIFLENI
jgi:hypothetical protein